jgi:hypothetical protein
MNVDGIEWERDKWSKLAKLVFKGRARLASQLANELIVDAQYSPPEQLAERNMDGSLSDFPAFSS